MARHKQSHPKKDMGSNKDPRAAPAKLAKKGKKEVKAPQKKRHRYRPGTVALREIRRYQKSTDLLIRRDPFRKLVREVHEKMFQTQSLQLNLRYQSLAVDALQHAAEGYLVSVFEDANLCTLHAGRVTLMQKDLQLAMRIRGERL